jgi:6-phosphogluconolactonase
MDKVFVQTNEADGNRVIVFQRGDDDALTELASVATGGNGDGVPHLTSQGSVVLTQDGTRLLVANAGSGDISVLAIANEASLVQVVPTGAAPKSVAEHAGLLYVLNTGAPSLAGFRLTNDGLEPLEGSLRELAPDADPAQVGFTPDGSALLVTERGTNSLVVFPVATDGLLGEPAESPSAGPTPYGFAFAKRRARRHRGVRRPEGEGGRLLLPADGDNGKAGVALGRKRAQRDLLGGRDEGWSLRVHHELCRRRGLLLGHRQ